MKKKVLLNCLVAMTVCLVSSAQTVIKLQIPPSGITLKSQLWNLSIINATTENLSLQIELMVSDASTNQKVFSGLSRMLNVQKGILMVSSATVSPVTYNVFNANYNVGNGPDGLLPPGTYTVCFSIYKPGYDVKQLIGEECATIDVEPLSPPLLISPANQDSIETNTPFFTWSSPGPLVQFSNLNYDFTLVEVKSVQNAPDAVQLNPPICSQKNIKANNIPYSKGLPPLEENKLYAWQITAKNNSSMVAKSEVWTFQLKTRTLQKLSDPSDYYVKLKLSDYESFIVSRPAFKFSYLNEANDKSVIIRLYDVTSSIHKEINMETHELELVYGENFKSLDISANSLSDKHMYLLDLTNSRGEHWFAKFQYRKSQLITY